MPLRAESIRKVSVRVARFALAVSVLIAGAACGGAPAPASQATAAATPPPASDTTVTPAWTPPARPTPNPRIVAFHAPHHDVACANCHGTPPGHATHQNINCTACHTRPPSYANLQPLPRSACRTCHHGPDQTRQCQQCHPAAARAGPHPVQVVIRTSVMRDSVMRTLTFDHTYHGKLRCAECHGGSINEPFQKTCSSCHARHHTPTADCARCHNPNTVLKRHTLEVHTGCGQSGCHTDRSVAAFPPTRQVCLACHAAQRNHRPGGDCATCHQIRAGWKSS